MPRYTIKITEVSDNQVPPGTYTAASYLLLPNTRHAKDVTTLAFTHAGLIRDDVAGALPAAIVAAITANGGSAA